MGVLQRREELVAKERRIRPAQCIPLPRVDVIDALMNRGAHSACVDWKKVACRAFFRH
jgi:hypothetical protein